MSSSIVVWLFFMEMWAGCKLGSEYFLEGQTAKDRKAYARLGIAGFKVIKLKQNIPMELVDNL